jgi:hypothetical protein
MPAHATQPASPSDTDEYVIIHEDEQVDDMATDVVVLDAPESTTEPATDIIVAGGDTEVVSVDDLLPTVVPTPVTAEPIEAMLARERVLGLEAEVSRLRRVAASLDERVVELVERVHHEERRGDTWQELALRGEDRVRENTLELARYRGFACSPWWVRLRGLSRSL